MHYVPETLLLADMLLKLAGHPEDRLAERTSLPPEALLPIRRGLHGKNLPRGSHHVRLDGGGYVVVKDVGRDGNPRHVVATVLSEDMSPPGYDVTYDVMDAEPNDVRVVKVMQGKDRGRSETYSASQKSSPNSHSFSETKTLSSVKVASFDLEDVRQRVRELQHDPDTLSRYVNQIRRENKYIKAGPNDLPIVYPPTNESEETMREVEMILSTMAREPLEPRFVDMASMNVNSVFYDMCERLGLDTVDDVAEDIAQDVLKIAMYLKYKFLRPRPYQLAPYYDGDIQSMDEDAEESPAYPSGHSMMGFALSKLYADLYPEHASTFVDLGRRVGLSRIQAGVHYPSDIQYAKALIEHLMGPLPQEKTASIMGAATGAYVAGGDTKQRAAGAVGGGIGGTIGNITGLVGGASLAIPLGYAPSLEGKSLKEIAKTPINSIKGLGGKGLALTMGLSTLGTVAGGAIGGKIAGDTYKKSKEGKSGKVPLLRTPNLDKLARG